MPPQAKSRTQRQVAEEIERKKLRIMASYERKARKQGYELVAGVDEAGRGPLAGPVVAAACILPARFSILGIDDSKKLTPQKRAELFHKITTHPDVMYGVGIVPVEVIDTINIYQATIRAMIEAIQSLPKQPHLLLVDGLQLPYPEIPSQKLIGGDALSLCIAAASIIAKETRDLLMVELDKQWPQYGFATHKGYGTPQHLEALRKHGPSPLHRRSFEPIKTLVSKEQELLLV